MKKYYLRYVVSLIAMLLTTTAWSQKRVEYDNAWYLIDDATSTATLTYKLADDGETPDGTYYSGTFRTNHGCYYNESDPEHPMGQGTKYYQLKKIGDHTFWYASNLTYLIIDTGVESLGDHLFSRTGVKKLTIEATTKPLATSVSEDGQMKLNSLSGLSFLEELNLNRDITTPEGKDVNIFEAATNLANVNIGTFVTKLPNCMFANCTGLQKIRVDAEKPVEVNANVFNGVDVSKVQLAVPMKCLAAYKAHPVWSQFAVYEMTPEEQYHFKVNTNVSWCSFSAVSEGVTLYYEILTDEKGSETGQVLLTAVPIEVSGGSYSGWITSGPYYQDRIVVPARVQNPATGATYTVRGLREYALEGDPYLSEVILPETIDTIAVQAFSSCGNLKHLDLPNSVAYLGQNCFAESGLEGKFVVPANVKVLESAIFRNTHITKLSFAEGSRLDSISDQSIFFMFELEELELPTGLRAIAYAGISSCPRLKKANLPEGLVKLDQMVLTGCPVEELVIPSTLVEIGEGFLSTGHQQMDGDGSSSLRHISVAEGNPIYDSREDCNAVILTATNTLYMAKAISKLPSTLEVIAANSYSDPCMKTLTLPASIKKIESYAFADAFMQRGATFSKIVSSIEEPAGVLEQNAFMKQNDYWEESDETYKKATLYVPAGTKVKYQADAEWGRFQNIVEEKPVVVEDAEPMKEETTTSFAGSTEITEETDLSATIVDNLFITLSTNNDDAETNDVYDAEEQAIVLNSTVADESKIDFVESTQASTDAVMNNFNGILFEVPAGSGIVTVTFKTTGNRMLAVKVGNQAASAFKQVTRDELEVPYATEVATHIYIYSVEELADDVATARAYARAYATAKMLKKGAGLKNMKRVAANRAPEETQSEKSQTLIYGIGWKPTETGIQTISAVPSAMFDSSAPVYNLTGQRVSAPQKGILIQSGRKVVVK